MPNRLGVAPHIDLTVLNGRGLVATSHGGQDVFSGAEYASIAQALHGRPTEAELFEAFTAPGAVEAIEQLRAAGVIVEADDTLPAGPAAFWAVDSLAPRRVAERVAAVSVAVDVIGDGDASEVLRTLE